MSGSVVDANITGLKREGKGGKEKCYVETLLRWGFEK